MKKEYTNPEITVTSFTQEDIIAASGLNTTGVQSSFDKSINFSEINF